MKRVAILVGAAAALALTSPADATLQIAFSNGGSSFFCQDQTACDLDGAVKNLLLLNTTVGDFKIVGTFAASSAGHPDTLSVSNLTITNMASTTETLRMAVGDTGFIGPAGLVFSSGSGTFNNGIGSTGALSFFADNADTQPAATSTDLPGTLLFNPSATAVTAPDSFAGTLVTADHLSTPFSMAEGAVITLKPGASLTGFNASMAAVPEPQTWALLGLGFGFMGLLGWRKSKSSRFAF